MAEDPSIAVIRILGNDLPPRHVRGAALAAARFILEREPALPRSRRLWILNRIADHRSERAIENLLRARGEAYEKIPFSLEGLGMPAAAQTPERRAAPLVRLNAARNLGLRRGRETAEWTLVLDGGCIFDSAGWEDLRREASESPARCLAVPMARLGRFSEYRPEGGPKPECSEEPQILIRSGSGIEFDESRIYGDRDKLALLKRCCRNGQTDAAGFVLRLPAGGPETSEGGVGLRARLRTEGLRRLVAQAEFGEILDF